MVIFIVTQVIKNVKVGVCKIYHLQLLKKEFKKAKKKKKKKRRQISLKKKEKTNFFKILVT
jgi:hypothetical protein